MRLHKLDVSHSEAFTAYLCHAWGVQWSSKFRDIVQWRFLDRPSGETWLLFDTEACVGAIDSTMRPYLLNGNRILLRETGDWFCVEKYRRFGWGIRLMRQMMKSEPMLVVGGSVANGEILPKLGWRLAQGARIYLLPIRARGTAAASLRRKWPQFEALAKLVPNLKMRSPRSLAAPGEPTVVRLQAGQPLPELPQPQRGLVQIIEQPQWEWLSQMPPGLARPIALIFYLNGRMVGFSISQIEPGRVGRIVHLQTVESEHVLGWIVSETSRVLMNEGVDLIRCLASTAQKHAALEQTGFMPWKDLPSYCWWQQDVDFPNEIDVGFLRGDDAVSLLPKGQASKKSRSNQVLLATG